MGPGWVDLGMGMGLDEVVPWYFMQSKSYAIWGFH